MGLIVVAMTSILNATNYIFSDVSSINSGQYVAKGDSGKQHLSRKDSTNHCFFISLSGGIGLPLLNFGSPTYPAYNQDNSFRTGYATKGLNVNLTGGYYISDDFGFLVKFNYNADGFNATSYVKNSYLSTDSNATVTGSSYVIESYLAGIIFKMPEGLASTNNKFSITAYALAGIMHVSNSTINEMHFGGSSLLKEPSANALELNVGLGATYSLTKNIGLLLNIDLLAGNPMFANYTITGTGNIPAVTTYNYKTYMSTAILNTSLGLIIHL